MILQGGSGILMAKKPNGFRLFLYVLMLTVKPKATIVRLNLRSLKVTVTIEEIK